MSDRKDSCLSSITHTELADDCAHMAFDGLGLRIGEITSRGPEHLVGGELIICSTPTWRPKSEHSERTLPVPDWCKAIPEGGFLARTSLNNWIKRASGSEDLSSTAMRQ
ncbi:hypothetical protein PMIT1327_01937 [Prochlorococcus marinus str. MIT 1327]|nr:hypothetical protein PMIT1312_02690 [Prochlorococcus marinus str. MIT 1312]KZR79874.1 hypothetical protein PMIT1327_01937 [Prochlorococcus marinus str. MIT 1327]